VQPHCGTHGEKQRNLRRAFGTTINTAVGSGPTRPTPLLILDEVRLAKCGGEEAIALTDASRRTTCGGCGGDRRIIGIPASDAESLSLPAPVNKDSVVGAPHQSVGRAERAELIAHRQDLVELFKKIGALQQTAPQRSVQRVEREELRWRARLASRHHKFSKDTLQCITAQWTALAASRCAD